MWSLRTHIDRLSFHLPVAIALFGALLVATTFGGTPQAFAEPGVALSTGHPLRLDADEPPLTLDVAPDGAVTRLTMPVTYGETYVVEGLPVSQDPWVDIRLTVIDALGTIAEDDDGGAYLMPKVVFTARETGDVFVDLCGVSEWTVGSYEVQARTIDPVRVRGTTTGVVSIPLPGAIVTAYTHDVFGHERTAQTRSDANGAWELLLESGTYRLGFKSGSTTSPELYHDGALALADADDIHLSAGTTHDLGSASAVYWSRLGGDLTDETGAPASGVSVAVYRLSRGTWTASTWTVTDSRGRWSAALVDGTYRIGYGDPTASDGARYHPAATSVTEASDIVLAGQDVYLSAQLEPVRATSSIGIASIAGANRYETAVEISRQSYPDGSASIIMVTGTSWPDGLGAASLSGALDAPILLVKPDALPFSVAEEISRLGATQAYIVGGTAAVSEDVLETLAGLGVSSAIRIGGTDRYETARLVAERVLELLRADGREWDGTYILASGDTFPDVLSASPLAASKCWPVLLTRADRLPEPSARFIADRPESSAVIVGGTAAVSDAVARDVGRMSATPAMRLHGSNRYGTALAVAEFARAEGYLDYSHIAVVTGQDFPDALACGARQGRLGSPLLLTPGGNLNAEVARLVESLSAEDCSDITFIGGAAVISPGVRDAVTTSLAR